MFAGEVVYGLRFELLLVREGFPADGFLAGLS